MDPYYPISNFDNTHINGGYIVFGTNMKDECCIYI